MKKRWKPIVAILAAGVLIGVTACSAPAQVGKPAPNFQLTDLNGQTVSLKDFRGKPVFINFWATWCPPCRAEMPDLQKAYDKWSPNGQVFLEIDVGESASVVRSFIESNGYTLPVLLDGKQYVSQAYGVAAFPTTFYIDKNGIIRLKKVGMFLSGQELDDFLSLYQE